MQALQFFRVPLIELESIIDKWIIMYYPSNTRVIFANFLVISDKTNFTLNAKDKQNQQAGKD